MRNASKGGLKEIFKKIDREANTGHAQAIDEMEDENESLNKEYARQREEQDKRNLERDREQQKTFAHSLEGKETDNLASMIRLGEKSEASLASSPESGGILAALGRDDLTRNLILENIKKGHTYSVLHAPGSPDFILKHTWNDPVKNERRTAHEPFSINQKPSAKEKALAVFAKKAEVEPVVAPKAKALAILREKAQEKKRGFHPSDLGRLPIEAGIIGGNKLYDFLTDEVKRALKAQEPKKVEKTPPPPKQEKVPAPKPNNEKSIRKELLDKIFEGKSQEEAYRDWDKIKKLSFNKFFYPEKFPWTEPDKVTPKQVTIDTYPDHAKNLHKEFATLEDSFEELGIDIENENISVNDAVNLLVKERMKKAA